MCPDEDRWLNPRVTDVQHMLIDRGGDGITRTISPLRQGSDKTSRFTSVYRDLVRPEA